MAEVVTHGTTGYICQRPEDLVGLSLRKPPAAVREKVTKMTDVEGCTRTVMDER